MRYFHSPQPISGQRGTISPCLLLPPDHALFAGDDLADDPSGNINLLASEASHDRIGVMFGDDRDEANAQVEDAVHLRLIDRAKLLEPGEDRGNRP